MIVQMTARYLQLCLGEGDMDPSRTHSLNDSGTETLFTRKDLEKCHGVAIWGLAADSGSCVPLHLDYAEQIRYDLREKILDMLLPASQTTHIEH